MAERLSFCWAVQQVNRRHLRDSAEWFLYMMVASLFPVWGGAILYWITPGGVSWLNFASHGEFALYSAALLAPAIHIAVTEREEVSFPSRGLFVLVAISFLLISVLIFAGITVLQHIDIIDPVEEESVALWSLALFAVSSLLSLIVNLFDNLRRAPDIQKLVALKQRVLEAKFDALN